MDRPSSHSQRVPYARKEGRKSLFSKMKDSMRDMLSPSWLTDLVHNVKQDSPNDSTDKDMPKGSDQSAGSQPGSSGMLGMSAQTPVLPTGPGGMIGSAGQQAGINRDSPFKNRGSFVGNGQPRTLDFAGVGQGVNPSGTVASPFQQGNFPPPLSEFTSAQLPLARITEKSDSIMAQEDTMSQRSDGSKSTSGCSSMIPQTDVPQRHTVGDKRKAPEEVTLGGISPQEQQSTKRQRLHVGSVANQTFTRRFNDSLLNKSSSHRPAFNTSLFGSPLNNESSLLGTTVHESSFYPGKTKFGGRSSLSFRSQRKRVDLNQSLPCTSSVPVNAFMKAKPKLNANKEAVTSSTAKRILEALDRMPTPLTDAKKIPVVPGSWTESPSFFSRDSRRSVARSGPPTQKLNISSQASISKNRQVSFAPPVQQPKASTSQVPAETTSRPARQDTVILNSESAAPSGKMRREKMYRKGSAAVKTALIEDDTLILPDLRTGFTLPVGSMPQFSFASPASQPKSNEPRTEDTLNRSPASTESPVKHSLNFTFSSPIIEPVPANKPASPQKYGGFQFSSPISVDKKEDSNVGPTNFSKPSVVTTSTFGAASTPAFSFSSPATKSNMDINFSTAPKPKPKINGPVEPAGGGFQVASVLKQGSVMDILGGGSSSKPFTTSSQSSTPLSTGSADSQVSNAAPLSMMFKQSGWSCDVCLINNKDDASKCLACQSPKPSGQKPKDSFSTNTTDSSEPLKSDLFAKFKQAGGSWTCDTCLIQNKQDDIKCVACQTRKPGSASSSSSPLVSTIQPGNWICNQCLIQNKKDDTICGACKAAKSASKPSEVKKTDSLFAKLKPTVGSWECEVCLVQNKADDNSCVACQTPKPLKFFKHPPGDWTCDTCLVVNKESAVNCVACNYARPGPPRTQTVPSIAKSYTLSQASGFRLNSEGSGSLSSTGGFKFTPSTSSSSSASGFDIAKMNENAKNSTDSSLTSGGFKFNSDLKSETSSGSGFKFGTQTTLESDKSTSSVNTGGFKIDTDAPSGDKPATGFQFGKSDTKSENKDGPLKSAGFQFGKSDSSLANVSSSASNTSTTVGVVFGQKSDTQATKDELQATTSVPGGFTFKSSDSSAKMIDLTKTVTSTSQNIGGFNFTNSTSNSLATTSSSSIGTYAFTATKVTDPSVLSGTSKPLDVAKPAIGGFSFGQKNSESNTSSSPFSFAQKPVSAASTTKRGRDDDTGEPEVKKSSFSFGKTATSNSSTPFQFGANTVTTTTSSSSPFVFGQAPATTSASVGVFGQAPATSISAAVFGQAPATTSASAGLFSFGQQNSTPASTTGQSVFGVQNSAPASSAIPSVFGQQNAIPTTTASATSNYIFGGSKPAPVATTATVLPVFGQTNSLATTTTASTSATSLFQFGQANNTAASTPFNFASQSSGQAPVFGSSTPNFNFTAQKTETSTAASASGLFKFGSNPSQPAPATTPAFGAGSAFGSSSTPAFGTGSGSSGAFSGNAPSTTPAFGAMPPAFGSSNSGTGQTAPAFGGKVSSVLIPVVSACMSTFLNVSALSTCSSSPVVSTCSKFSTKPSTVSVYSSVMKVSSNKGSNFCVIEKSSKNFMNIGSDNNDLNNKVPSHSESSSSSSALGTTTKNTSTESFFHGCYEDLDDDIEERERSNDGSLELEVKLESASQNITQQQQVIVDMQMRKSEVEDAACQTNNVSSEASTADIQTKSIENHDLQSRRQHHCNRGIQTEWPYVSEKEAVSTLRSGKAESISKIQNDVVIERSAVDTKITENGLKDTPSESNNFPLKPQNKTILGAPKTGIANEPLSCGKLFVVPTFINCLDNATILCPSITKPLMTSKLPGLPNTGSLQCQNLAVMTEPSFTPASTSISSVFRFGATSAANLSLSSAVLARTSVDNSRLSLSNSLNLPAWTMTSLAHDNLTSGISQSTQLSSLNLPGKKATSADFGSERVPASCTKIPVFGRINLPAATRSEVFSGKKLPKSTLPIFGNSNLPSTEVKSPLLRDTNLPTSSNMSVIFSNARSIFESPGFGSLSLPSNAVGPSVFGLTSLPFRTATNVSLQSANVRSSVFGNTNLASCIERSPVFNIVSSPNCSVSSQIFGSRSLPNSTVLPPVFYNMSLPSSSVLSPVFGSGSLPSKHRPVFGSVNLPSSAATSQVYGNSFDQSSSISTSNSSKANGSTMNNKSGFVVKIPFKPDMFLQARKESHSGTDKMAVSQSTSKSTSTVFTFGRPSVSTVKSINQPSTFIQGTNESCNRNGESTRPQNANTPASNIFVFGRPAKSAEQLVRTSLFRAAPCFSSDSVLTCGNDSSRLSENVAMQTNRTDTNGRSSHLGGTGVFSFQGPAVLDDVVMEEGSSDSEQISDEPGISRKVAFSFCQPVIANDESTKKEPQAVNKVGKSILKSKSKEVRLAFDTAILAGKENPEMADCSTDKREMTKIPSDSCIVNGKNFPGDAQRLVCNSKSMPFTSDFMMKEGNEGHTGTFRFTNHNTKSVALNTRDSQPSQCRHSSGFVFGKMDNSSNKGSYKSTAGGFKSPLPFKTLKFGSISTECSATTNFVRNFPPLSPDVFVFSSNTAPSFNVVKTPSGNSKKKKNFKSRTKLAVVTAFSGKPQDASFTGTGREPSPSSSRFSKSSESTHSGSGISINSSSAGSSDSGHSVSSSSSSSGTSSDSDADHGGTGSQPMEDEVGSGNGGVFSDPENKSWNACPSDSEERIAESWAVDVCCPGHEKLHIYILPLLVFSGVFGNTNQPAAPVQSNSVFQFGAKPADSTQAAPAAGFNFSASANPAGLGAGPNFNFSAQGSQVNAFSATGPSAPADGRKIKKAVRKIRR